MKVATANSTLLKSFGRRPNPKKFKPYIVGVRYCWPPYYFKDGEQNTFLIRMHVSSTFICAWVSHVGTKEDCKKFEVVIGFHVPRQCLERVSQHYSQWIFVQNRVNSTGSFRKTE